MGNRMGSKTHPTRFAIAKLVPGHRFVSGRCLGRYINLGSRRETSNTNPSVIVGDALAPVREIGHGMPPLSFATKSVGQLRSTQVHGNHLPLEGGEDKLYLIPPEPYLSIEKTGGHKSGYRTIELGKYMGCDGRVISIPIIDGESDRTVEWWSFAS
jgi:hypothetical protein